MTNSIGPIVGAGLSIVALGVTAQAAMGIIKETQKATKPSKSRRKYNPEDVVRRML